MSRPTVIIVTYNENPETQWALTHGEVIEEFVELKAVELSADIDDFTTDYLEVYEKSQDLIDLGDRIKSFYPDLSKRVDRALDGVKHKVAPSWERFKEDALNLIRMVESSPLRLDASQEVTGVLDYIQHNESSQSEVEKIEEEFCKDE